MGIYDFDEPWPGFTQGKPNPNPQEKIIVSTAKKWEGPRRTKGAMTVDMVEFLVDASLELAQCCEIHGNEKCQIAIRKFQDALHPFGIRF